MGLCHLKITTAKLLFKHFVYFRFATALITPQKRLLEKYQNSSIFYAGALRINCFWFTLPHLLFFTYFRKPTN